MPEAAPAWWLDVDGEVYQLLRRILHHDMWFPVELQYEIACRMNPEVEKLTLRQFKLAYTLQAWRGMSPTDTTYGRVNAIRRVLIRFLRELVEQDSADEQVHRLIDTYEREISELMEDWHHDDLYGRRRRRTAGG